MSRNNWQAHLETVPNHADDEDISTKDEKLLGAVIRRLKGDAACDGYANAHADEVSGLKYEKLAYDGACAIANAHNDVFGRRRLLHHR